VAESERIRTILVGKKNKANRILSSNMGNLETAGVFFASFFGGLGIFLASGGFLS
jgi:hypothetical protein